MHLIPTISFRCNPLMRNVGLPSSVAEVSGNSTAMPSRKSACICECMALMSTIAAANCLKCESSNAAVSVVAISELLVGVDVRFGVPAYRSSSLNRPFSVETTQRRTLSTSATKAAATPFDVMSYTGKLFSNQVLYRLRICKVNFQNR